MADCEGTGQARQAKRNVAQIRALARMQQQTNDSNRQSRFGSPALHGQGRVCLYTARRTERVLQLPLARRITEGVSAGGRGESGRFDSVVSESKGRCHSARETGGRSSTFSRSEWKNLAVL